MTRIMWNISLFLLLIALHQSVCQPSDANVIDPRHNYDKRCPKAAILDPVGKERDPASSSSYLWTRLHTGSTIKVDYTILQHYYNCYYTDFF